MPDAKHSLLFSTVTDDNKEIQFTVDVDGQLNINGKKVLTEQKITFSKVTGLFAILAAIGTFGTFIISLLTFINRS